MKKEIRYIPYYSKNCFYLVKLIYVPHEIGDPYPTVYIRIMKPHPLPNNFWERISENFKYCIAKWAWHEDSSMSLKDTCLYACQKLEQSKVKKVKKVNKEHRCHEEWRKCNLN